MDVDVDVEVEAKLRAKSRMATYLYSHIAMQSCSHKRSRRP